jgi:hypothetical protein
MKPLPAGCPDDDLVDGFVQNTIETEEREMVLAHIEACARCRRLLSELVKDDEEPPESR